jgi:hypothetical protein
MDEKIEHQSPSSGMESSSSSWSSQQPLPETSPSSKYYRTIYQLPLSRFIDAQVDKNLFALVISGTPSIVELTAAWESIKLEYADKMGDLEYRMYLNLFKDINRLKATIDEIRELVAILQETYVEKFIRKLNNLLVTNFVFDVSKPAEYDKLLDRCYNMTGGLQLRLELLMNNYKAIEAKHAGNKEPGREYYLSLLITLSDNAGYGLSESITVFEFCERMARATEKVKTLKKQANGRK